MAAGERATEALVAAVWGSLSTSVAAAAFLFLVSGGVVKAFLPVASRFYVLTRKKGRPRDGMSRPLFLETTHSPQPTRNSRNFGKRGGGGMWKYPDDNKEENRVVEGKGNRAALALSRSLRGELNDVHSTAWAKGRGGCVTNSRADVTGGNLVWGPFLDR